MDFRKEKENERDTAPVKQTRNRPQAGAAHLIDPFAALGVRTDAPSFFVLRGYITTEKRRCQANFFGFVYFLHAAATLCPVAERRKGGLDAGRTTIRTTTRTRTTIRTTTLRTIIRTSRTASKPAGKETRKAASPFFSIALERPVAVKWRGIALAFSPKIPYNPVVLYRDHR